MFIDDWSGARPGAVAWKLTAGDTPLAEEFYRNAISDWYSVTDIATDQPFYTESQVYQFGDYVVGRGRSSGQMLVRGPDEIRRSGLDSVALILDLGGMKGDADGRDVNAAPGSFHVRDLARPSRFKVKAVDAIVVAMPRDRAPQWLVDQNAHGLNIDGTPRISRLLRGHLTALMRAAPGLSVDDGANCIEAALVMAETAFRNTGALTATQSEAVQRGLRASAVALIDQRLNEQDLKVDWLVSALGTSRATLFRAFALSGGINLYIKERRLERAREALAARVDRRPSIAEIGRAHGFVSESHFSRSFRDQFGYPPSVLQSPEPPSARAAHGSIRFDLVLGWMGGNRGADKSTSLSREAACHT